jgi:citrate lyase beta subunit
MKAVPRSFLFTPASRPDRFDQAMSSNAGGVILDLEDAVAEEDKDEAREEVQKYFARSDQRSIALAVRINTLTSVHGLRDLAMLANSSNAPDFFLIPKSEEPTYISLVGKVLDEANSVAEIGALIETGNGVANSPALATSHPRLKFLMFGSADYAADLGQRVGVAQYEHARATIVNAAACGGVAAIDAPCFDIADCDALGAACSKSKELGFHGKAAIHPSQLDVISNSFASTDSDRALASKILQAALRGVGVIDGQMIDHAMIRWANKIAQDG